MHPLPISTTTLSFILPAGYHGTQLTHIHCKYAGDLFFWCRIQLTSNEDFGTQLASSHLNLLQSTISLLVYYFNNMLDTNRNT